MYDVINVRNSALSALPPLLNEYFQDNIKVQENIIKKYIESLKQTTSQVVRMGNISALGVLPAPIIESFVDIIIEAVLRSMVITPETLKWAESRRDAIKSLASICSSLQNRFGTSK